MLILGWFKQRLDRLCRDLCWLHWGLLQSGGGAEKFRLQMAVSAAIISHFLNNLHKNICHYIHTTSHCCNSFVGWVPALVLKSDTSAPSPLSPPFLIDFNFVLFRKLSPCYQWFSISSTRSRSLNSPKKQRASRTRTDQSKSYNVCYAFFWFFWRTDGRTDIRIYRVASLLKSKSIYYKQTKTVKRS